MVFRKGARKTGPRRHHPRTARRPAKRRISKRPHGRGTRKVRPRSKVSPTAGQAPEEPLRKHPGGRPRGSGGIHLENTLKEQDVLDVLLEPNVATYADAAKRLGITENAVKQRMGRVLFRYRKAKWYTNGFEQWQIKRRKAKELRKHGYAAAWRARPREEPEAGTAPAGEVPQEVPVRA